MSAYYIGLKTNTALATTMAFATLTIARLFHGFNCRGKESIRKLKLKTNPYQIMAFVAGNSIHINSIVCTTITRVI